jgi:gliding motility-associated-like protein
VNGAVYAWSPATALTCSNCPNPTASPTETTTYTLTVTTPAGCVIDTNITIVVEKLCADLIFPNIFTPNGDKTNDYYEIDTKCLSEFTHWIVNRWGNTMFRTSEMNVFWDGLVEGNPASEGIYFINYIGIKSNGEPIKGQTFFHLDR